MNLKRWLTLQDDSWVQAMQEELLQFKLQQVWVLVDLPHGMKVIGTKWVYRNKRDERGVVVRINTIGGPRYTQEEGIDYDEALRAHMKRVYVSQPPGFLILIILQKVYKVVKAFMDYIQAPRGLGQQVKTTKKEIFISTGQIHDRASPHVTPTTSSSQCSQENLQSITRIADARQSGSGNLLILGRYAFTSNPTIYDSLVKQFWQTATTNTKADGTLEINATIDTIGYTITEASIRDTLQLADVTGITMLPNDEIFRGMGQMGKTKLLMYPSFLQMSFENIQTENNTLSGCSLTKKDLWNMKRGFRGAPRPLLPAMLLVATNPNAGQEQIAVAQTQPSSSTPPVPSTSSPPVQSPPQIPASIPTPTPIPASIPSPTPIPETEPALYEHTFEEPSLVHQHFSPPQEQAQGQMTMDDLLQLVKKVKKLEGFLKRRNVVVSDSEEENLGSRGGKSDEIH
ncbi:hypothetical protein Tco_0911611 [Tanacetum coccineum]|uniref:Reverse transcriptase Ty1/copia-type domain-containing protein n=1 Tax=Tanacetum coccineum TaxID=301880 RepID=A0ABQ5CZJ9_9ASTR